MGKVFKSVGKSLIGGAVMGPLGALGGALSGVGGPSNVSVPAVSPQEQAIRDKMTGLGDRNYARVTEDADTQDTNRKAFEASFMGQASGEPTSMAELLGRHLGENSRAAFEGRAAGNPLVDRMLALQEQSTARRLRDTYGAGYQGSTPANEALTFADMWKNAIMAASQYGVLNPMETAMMGLPEGTNVAALLQSGPAGFDTLFNRRQLATPEQYGSLATMYGNDRAMQFGANQQNTQSKNDFKSGMLKSITSLVGTGAGMMMGGPAGAAVGGQVGGAVGGGGARPSLAAMYDNPNLVPNTGIMRGGGGAPAYSFR